MVAAPRRYRLKLATWTVVREPGQPSPRTLSSPLAVVELAKDLVLAADDDKEHFLVVLLNAQNHYLLHTEVSVGTQSASLVHSREVLGPVLREGAASIILLHNHPSGDPTPSREASGSRASLPTARGCSTSRSTTTSSSATVP